MSTISTNPVSPPQPLARSATQVSTSPARAQAQPAESGVLSKQAQVEAGQQRWEDGIARLSPADREELQELRQQFDTEIKQLKTQGKKVDETGRWVLRTMEWSHEKLEEEPTSQAHQEVFKGGRELLKARHENESRDSRPQNLTLTVDRNGNAGGNPTTVWGALRQAGWTNREIANQGLVERVARDNGLKNANVVSVGAQLVVPRKEPKQEPTFERGRGPGRERSGQQTTSAEVQSTLARARSSGNQKDWQQTFIAGHKSLTDEEAAEITRRSREVLAARHGGRPSDYLRHPQDAAHASITAQVAGAIAREKQRNGTSDSRWDALAEASSKHPFGTSPPIVPGQPYSRPLGEDYQPYTEPVSAPVQALQRAQASGRPEDWSASMDRFLGTLSKEENQQIDLTARQILASRYGGRAEDYLNVGISGSVIAQAASLVAARSLRQNPSDTRMQGLHQASTGSVLAWAWAGNTQPDFVPLKR